MAQHYEFENDMKRTVLLFGSDLPWTRERILKEAFEAGLNPVFAKVSSDHSDSLLAKSAGAAVANAAGALRTAEVEILPDRYSDLSREAISGFRERYGSSWCALPLNDYMSEYAAALSTELAVPCYPAQSAEIAKRKHKLRDLWNRLAHRAGSRLLPVEHCYIEAREDGSFEFNPGLGFSSLPENTQLIVKPDELSSSIEVYWAASKTEATTIAHKVCIQLLNRWYEIGRNIGTELRPRVVVEMAIERAEHLHPGAEFSIEFVSFEGSHHAVGVTQKWTGPNFIETGHLFPAESLPAGLESAVETSMRELLVALNVNYGVSHWEFIVTPDERIALVEGHLRAAGDRIMELIQHSTGRAPTGPLLKALAGREADFSFRPHRSAGIFWMVPQTPLAEVTDIQVGAAAQQPDCHDVHLRHDRIKAKANWSHAEDWTVRLAHVMATGENLESILGTCRRVAEDIVLVGSLNGSPASTPLMLAIDQDTPAGRAEMELVWDKLARGARCTSGTTSGSASAC